MRAGQTKTCFVIMPFGTKTASNPLWTEFDSLGMAVDFDAVYRDIIVPAVTELGITCVRCDEITKAGSIHKKMIGSIADAEVAVVDLSTLNPNVFYELGVRHALRPAVTILLRRQGLENTLPFNIGGMTVIDYDPESPGKAQEAIKEYITAGLADKEWQDSLVFQALEDLRVSVRPRRAIEATERHEWTVEGAGERRVGVITGDIAAIKGIDIWANSENTDMQMARFHEMSLSGVIRFLAASKSASGAVTEDLLPARLAAALRDEGRTNVEPGQVIPTSTKENLYPSHGVRWVFHAATVVGQRGRGYHPIPDLAACVRNSLDRMDASEFQSADAAEYGSVGSTSILMPLFGVGAAQADLATTAKDLIDTAVTYLKRTPDTAIEKVYFLVFTQDELTACADILDARLDTNSVT